jgi:hypothetical protein
VNLSDRLATALAVRLNLQISVTSLAIIDEAMDAPLGRWLDSAPLPLDSADGNDVAFEVRLQSDLSRVRFAMHGLAGGVIKRLGAYLRESGLPAAEAATIERLPGYLAGHPVEVGPGPALVPPRLGSFVSIEPRRLTSGWLVPVELGLDAVAAHLPAVAAGVSPAWLAGRGVREVAGLWQALGQGGHTDLWIAPPGDRPADIVDAADEMFVALGGGRLPEVVRAVARRGERLRVVARNGGPPRLALAIAGVGRAALCEIADALGERVDPALEPLIDTLGARDLDGLEYVVDAGRPGLVATISPSGVDRAAPARSN